MNLLNQIADTILVISLASREDRRAQIRECFESERIEYEFFDGIVPDRERILLRDVSGMECYGNLKRLRGDYPTNALGCRLAYFEAMRSCVESGSKRFILFQDDVIFRNRWRELLNEAIAQLPASFDLLHFSSAARKTPTAYSSNLRRVLGARCLTATLFNAPGAARILESLSTANSECDVWFERKIHPHFECYQVHPAITRQRVGVSSITGRRKSGSP